MIGGILFTEAFLLPATDSVLDYAGVDHTYVGALAADPVAIKLEAHAFIKEDRSKQLIVKGVYYNGTVKTLSSQVTFFSKDSAVVSVDKNCMLQALKKGKTVISANYHGLETKVEIHVQQAPPGLQKNK